MTSSWLDIPEDSDFSLQNIPFGVCSLEEDPACRCVTAIGDKVVDLGLLQDAGAFSDVLNLNANAFSEPTLNGFMSHDPQVWKQVRKRLVDIFSGQNAILQSNPALQTAAIYHHSKVVMHLPAKIGGYTDFYSSREHATNGKSFLSSG